MQLSYAILRQEGLSSISAGGIMPTPGTVKSSEHDIADVAIRESFYRRHTVLNEHWVGCKYHRKYWVAWLPVV